MANKIAQLVRILVEQDVKQPFIGWVRSIGTEGPNYINVEKMNSNFLESTPNNDNLIYNVRLSIDEINVGLSFETPIINSRVLIIYTNEKIPIAINYNKIGDIIKNYTNQTINSTNLTTNVNGTSNYNYSGLTNIISDDYNINSKSLTIKTDNNITLNPTGKLSLKNSVDIKDIFNDIYNSLNIINTKVAGITGPTGAEPYITDLTLKINTLF